MMRHRQRVGQFLADQGKSNGVEMGIKELDNSIVVVFIHDHSTPPIEPSQSKSLIEYFVTTISNSNIIIMKSIVALASIASFALAAPQGFGGFGGFGGGFGGNNGGGTTGSGLQPGQTSGGGSGAGTGTGGFGSSSGGTGFPACATAVYSQAQQISGCSGASKLSFNRLQSVAFAHS